MNPGSYQEQLDNNLDSDPFLNNIANYGSNPTPSVIGRNKEKTSKIKALSDWVARWQHRWWLDWLSFTVITLLAWLGVYTLLWVYRSDWVARWQHRWWLDWLSLAVITLLAWLALYTLLWSDWVARWQHRWWLDWLSLAVITLLAWLALYTLLGHEVSLTGDLFRLLVLVLCAVLAGPLSALCRLPPLLGMLLTGVLLRSVGFYHVQGIYPGIVRNIRQVAMTVILVKAGLGLDAATLARLSLVVARLGLLPCSLEAATFALAAHFFVDFPWLWALLLGFLVSAISPAVVVPTLLDLQAQGYGCDKGIPTLVLAACSLDDITCVSMFFLFLGAMFSTGDLTDQILQGPTDITVGLCGGVLWGAFSGLLPHRHDELVGWKRAAMVGGGGLVAVLGAPKAGFPSAGPLACVTIAFIGSLMWKNLGEVETKPAVSDVFSALWRLLEPMLYAFIGAEVDVTILDMQTVSWGAAIICGALVVRVMTCGLVLLGAGLNWKEKLFVALAWLPKATVQAALAPVPLERVKASSGATTQELTLASQLLTVAVLAILITSPLGAIATSLAGPKLLSRRH